MLEPGCSSTKPHRRAKQIEMIAADLAACLFAFKTQRRRKSPRGVFQVRIVLFRDMNTHVEHTVPSHTEPIAGCNWRSS